MFDTFFEHPRTHRRIHSAGAHNFMTFNKSHKLHRKIFKRKCRLGVCWVRSSSVSFLRLSFLTFFCNNFWVNLKSFCLNKSFSGGHWYPCFGLLVTSPLGFKARVNFSLACFLTCVQWISQIHLWCDTYFAMRNFYDICTETYCG